MDIVGVSQLEAKECHGWQATTRSWKKHRRILPRVADRVWPS